MLDFSKHTPVKLQNHLYLICEVIFVEDSLKNNDLLIIINACKEKL